MRSMTYKLSLTVVALLLAHCATPSDSDSGESEAAVGQGGTFDSRDGLLSLYASKDAPRTRSNDPAADAIAYVTAAAESAGAKNPEFKVTDVGVGADGLTHVRVQQVYAGVAVWGADCVVHLSNAAVVGAAGTVAAKLDGAGNRGNAVSENDALAKAKHDRYGSREVVTEREKAELVVHINDDGVARDAIHTSFYNELQGDIEPALWNHIIDAENGKILARWNGVHSLEQASGPGGNPKWEHSWKSELDAEPKSSQYVLTTSRLKTLDMKNGTGSGSEVLGSLAAIGDAPINDAHGFAEITLTVLKDFGHDSINDRGFQIISRVHYSSRYENAFWNGSQMTYGDGANTFYPLSGGLDVVAHEIHHGFTSFHSNLTYSGQSGGLNESFSDIAGKVAEFFYKENPNFDLGADVFKAPNKALRYMCEPTKDGKSIEHASKYTNGIDVHYSSGVQNKMFCLASKRFSSGSPTGAATKAGVRRVAEALYLANAKYWTSSTNFTAGCKGHLDAARALNFTEEELANLRTSWADVGVTCN